MQRMGKTMPEDPNWLYMYAFFCVIPSFHISSLDIYDCIGATCQNGGTCLDGVNGHTCQCADGFTGHHCESGEIKLWLQK